MYSKNVDEFLVQYYMGHDSFYKTDDLKNLLDDEKLIHGRCGYIRQGYPLIIKDYDFNKINLHVDGLNGKLSDIDYYDAARTAVSDAGLHPDTSAPPYFKNNKAISYLTKYLSGDDKREKGKNGKKPAKGDKTIRDYYLDGLAEILKLFEQSVQRTTTILSLLESLKNSFIGKVHMPHSPMMNHGIHALTFEAVYSPAVAKKATQGVIDDVIMQES